MIKPFIALTLLLSVAFAEASRHPTRQNEVTDMFDKEIEDKAGLEQMIDNSKTDAEQGIASKQSLQVLDLKESELEGKTHELNSINANSLESAGQQERAKEENAYYDALEIDYTDPKVINHHKDMGRILSASDKLMNRLIEGLKELGVDCKTVKGDKEIEPELYLDIVKEEQKDTVYDQHICEELRNQYSCGDSLGMSCKQKGMEWGEWQDKKIIVSGDELIDYKNDLLTSQYVAKETFEYKMLIYEVNHMFGKYKPDPALIDRMRVYLATKHENATKDNIDIIMRAEWGGGIHSIAGREYAGGVCGHKAYVHLSYHIYYKYRDGKPACLSWSEEWSEKCTLK